MPPEEKDWKKLNRTNGRGGSAYLPKDRLQKLEDEGVIDLDEPLEYSINHGVSDGRARFFIRVRNVPEDRR